MGEGSQGSICVADGKPPEGWLGAKRLSKEFCCSRNTVRRYLRAGGPVVYRKPERWGNLDGLEDWLWERFFPHDIAAAL